MYGNYSGTPRTHQEKPENEVSALLCVGGTFLLFVGGVVVGLALYRALTPVAGQWLYDYLDQPLRHLLNYPY